MTRPHIKRNKKQNTKAPSKIVKKQEDTSKFNDLDRFAGSSEEDEAMEPGMDTDDENHESSEESGDEDESVGEKQVAGDDDNDEEEEDRPDEDSSSDDDEYGVPSMNTTRAKSKAQSDSDTSSDSEEPLTETSQNGMAGAMTRILGLAAAAKPTQTSKPVVLSKTITPLQKQQQKEKQVEDALKLKRKQRRDVNLTALHIPLSAATSRPIAGKGTDSSIVAKAMAKEIEVESMHRRVATRGVVALFNAITQHQQQKAQQQVDSSSKSKKNNDIQTMSKHGFLDMLKKTGSSKEQSSKQEANTVDNTQPTKEKKSSKGWNALKDDFLMNKKMKDWDKELSDDEDSEEEYDGRRTEGLKRNHDDDDIMDDDWSSDDQSPKKRKIN